MICSWDAECADTNVSSRRLDTRYVVTTPFGLGAVLEWATAAVHCSGHSSPSTHQPDEHYTWCSVRTGKNVQSLK